MIQCLKCAWYRLYPDNEMDEDGEIEEDKDTIQLALYCVLEAKVGKEMKPCYEVNPNEDCQLIEHARP